MLDSIRFQLIFANKNEIVKAIGYYITLPFLFILSIMPFPLMYAFSSVVCFFLFFIFRYRRKTILTNLHNSFPEKTEKEIRKLARMFYFYFCDLVIETFKTLTIGRKSMLKHCSLTPQAVNLFNGLAEEKKSLILVLGHLGNWEWAGNSFSLQCKHQLYVIYHPLVHPYFNQLIIEMRTRFGTRLIPMKETFREMVRRKEEISATAFIADQTPSPEGAYWTLFLNQETPVFRGTGLIAGKLGYPVVYMWIERMARGRYQVHAEILIENPKGMNEEDITELHTRRLERDIQKFPSTWLWSHRRWKHKRVRD